MSPTPGPPTPDETTYAVIELVDGDVVIYDPDNAQAWIQSDRGVALAESA
jgi:hypothetical protein